SWASQRGVWLALGCGYASRMRVGAAAPPDPPNAGGEPDVLLGLPPALGGWGGRAALGLQATSHAAMAASSRPRHIGLSRRAAGDGGLGGHGRPAGHRQIDAVALGVARPL